MRESVYLSKIDRKVFIEKLTIYKEEKIESICGLNNFFKSFAMTDPEKDTVRFLTGLWEMLSNEDKDYLVKTEFFEYEGFEKKKITFSEPWKMLKAVISGQDEIVELMKVMMRIIDKSQVRVTESDKKKVKEE